MNSEITIPKWVWMVGVALAILFLGIGISPRGADGHPLLLSPDVKALNDYRISLSAWHDKLVDLNGRIARILSNNYGGDLFSQSSEGQKVLNETIRILEEIDQTSTTAAAVPARDLTLNAASATLSAAQLSLLWISAPTPVNLDTAGQALDAARANLTSLEASQWMTPR
ncbi:MAG: hypothetical protein NTW32_26765 [Chloroflexi bacterium]|nr:hypothetical protein [Chloroflexota bacterium]